MTLIIKTTVMRMRRMMNRQTIGMRTMIIVGLKMMRVTRIMTMLMMMLMVMKVDRDGDENDDSEDEDGGAAGYNV